MLGQIVARRIAQVIGKEAGRQLKQKADAADISRVRSVCRTVINEAYGVSWWDSLAATLLLELEDD